MKLSFKKLLVYSFLLILGCYLFTAISIYSYSKTDQTQKADAAIVLGTAVWGDEPSPVFRERIRHGIWLYQNNYVDYLIFTGGKGEGRKRKFQKSIAGKRSPPHEKGNENGRKSSDRSISLPYHYFPISIFF